MRYLLLISLVLMLTACGSSINSDDWAYGTELCKNNGGLDWMKYSYMGSFEYTVKCNNTAKFQFDMEMITQWKENKDDEQKKYNGNGTDCTNDVSTGQSSQY